MWWWWWWWWWSCDGGGGVYWNHLIRLSMCLSFVRTISSEPLRFLQPHLVRGRSTRKSVQRTGQFYTQEESLKVTHNTNSVQNYIAHWSKALKKLKRTLFNSTKQDKTCKFSRNTSFSSCVQHKNKQKKTKQKKINSLSLCWEAGGRKRARNWQTW